MTVLQRGRRVLVTGGAGFLGSHLVEALAVRGAEVTVADNLSTGRMSNLDGVASSIRFERLDLATDDIAPLLVEARFDTIFHAAASAYVPTSIEDPAGDLRDNVLATHRLLVAIRSSASATELVHFSTAAVYGEGRGAPMSEDEPTRPVSPYGISKLAAELYVTMYARLFGLRACSVRLFSLFGPRLRKQVVWDFMNRIAADSGELVVHGDGGETRDLSHVNNAVAAALLIADCGAKNGEVYNFGAGASTSINDLAHTLCSAMDAAPALRYTLSGRAGDARRWSADVERLRALGYTPSITYEEGIFDTVAWFRSIPADSRK